MNSAHIRLKKV